MNGLNSTKAIKQASVSEVGKEASRKRGNCENYGSSVTVMCGFLS